MVPNEIGDSGPRREETGLASRNVLDGSWCRQQTVFKEWQDRSEYNVR